MAQAGSLQSGQDSSYELLVSEPGAVPLPVSVSSAVRFTDYRIQTDCDPSDESLGYSRIVRYADGKSKSCETGLDNAVGERIILKD